MKYLYIHYSLWLRHFATMSHLQFRRDGDETGKGDCIPACCPEENRNDHEGQSRTAVIATHKPPEEPM